MINYMPILVIHLITKVIQNNTDMYIKEHSQQTFKRPNNDVDIAFEEGLFKHNRDFLTKLNPCLSGLQNLKQYSISPFID